MARVAGLLAMAGLALVAAPALGQSLSTGRVLAQATIDPSESAQATAPAGSGAQVASADTNGYTPAPMPDADEAAPVAKPLGPPEAQWSPNLFYSQGGYRGEGFTPGSTAQASQQRNGRPAAGISLNVPLE